MRTWGRDRDELATWLEGDPARTWGRGLVRQPRWQPGCPVRYARGAGGCPGAEGGQWAPGPVGGPPM